MSSNYSLKNLHERRGAILARLMRHAARHSPYYRDHDWAERLRNGLSVRFVDLPITRKSALKQNAEAFTATKFRLPKAGLSTSQLRDQRANQAPSKRPRFTFGSTPQKMRVYAKVGDFESQTGHIHTSSPRRDHPPRSVENRGKNGFSNNWTIYTLEPKPIVDLLCRTKCSHIRMYPSQAVAVLEMAPPLDFLKLVSTVGEIIPPEFRLSLPVSPAVCTTIHTAVWRWDYRWQMP